MYISPSPLSECSNYIIKKEDDSWLICTDRRLELRVQFKGTINDEFESLRRRSAQVEERGRARGRKECKRGWDRKAPTIIDITR